MPTQKYMNLGLFTVKKTTVVHSDKRITVNKTAKTRGRGQEYFVVHILGVQDRVWLHNSIRLIAASRQ